MWHFLALFLCQTSQAGLQFLFLYRVLTQRKVDGLNAKRGRLSIKCRKNSFEDLDLSFPLWLCLQPLLNLSEQYGKKNKQKKQKQQEERKTSQAWGELPFALSFGAGLWGVISLILIGCLDFWGPLVSWTFGGRGLISSRVEGPGWNKWYWRSYFFLKFQKDKLVLNKFLFYLNIKEC